MQREQIEILLKNYKLPYIETDAVSAKALKEITVTPQGITIELVFGFPLAKAQQKLSAAIAAFLTEKLATHLPIHVSIQSSIVSHAVQGGLKGIPGVKNVIAVASGKGGVGKSTTAVNLALALAAEGAAVGILDADIYGPNQPQMLGAKRQPDSNDGKSLEPVMSHGLQSMSIGYLVDTETAMIWRGPMVTSALQQLLYETQWHDLDYLIVDLPPGTGDIHLSLAQKIPVAGAVIVTTPQEIALLDARKGIKMFEKVNIPLLGIVENMSLHRCTQCGHTETIFGEGGGETLAKDYQIPFLGALPLELRIRECADRGTPIVVADPNSDTTERYREIARKLSARLALRAKNYANRFPEIVIQND